MIRRLVMAGLIATFPVSAIAQPAEAVVRHFLDDYQAKNLAGIVAASDPAVTMALPFAPGAPVLHGRDAAAAYLDDVFRKYRTISLGDVVLTPAADRRTVTVEAVATFETPSGEPHQVGYVWVMTVANSRIVSARNYILPLSVIPN